MHCHQSGKYSGDTPSIYHLKYSAPKEILAVFYNETNYDYYKKASKKG